MSGGEPGARLLTPRAPGGVAVVALVGAERFVVAARLLGGLTVDASPRLRWLVCDGERLDQALVFDRPAGATIELHVHGSEAVLRGMERVLGPLQPARLEVRARAVRSATSLAQLDFVLEQQRLLTPFADRFANWLQAHAGDAATLRAAQARAATATALITPCVVALCGRKNAGKSTLMNRLLFTERVLTGPTPGLTRDPVCESVTLDGYPYELIDTAGEGEAIDDLDARAIARSRAARAAALQVLVVDGSVGIADLERALLAVTPRPWVVRTKVDLPLAPWPADLLPSRVDVSCVTGATPDVRAIVGEWLRAMRGLPPAGPLGGVAPCDADERALLRAALGS